MTGQWGGAQWLVVFMIVARTLIGAAVAMGTINVRKDVLTPTERYRNSRIFDAVLIAVLVWGGFFS